jgi:hypothetical protein
MRHFARPAVRVALLGVASLALLGMGSFGGGRETGEPARDFSATFTDVDGKSMAVQRVTASGDTSLEGELGRGRLRVPFDNVAHIGFQPSPTDRERMLADVRLREGEPVSLSVRASTTFYGRLPGGAYQIRARDLRSIDFAP